MSRETMLIVLGLLTMVVPYLGVPSAWRTGLLVLIGAVVTVVGFLQRGEALRAQRTSSTEHHPFQDSARHGDDARISEPEFHSE